MIIPGAPIKITLDELLEKVSDIQIAYKYVSNFKEVGKAFTSELRLDRRPNSCFIFVDRATGMLKYKDFGDTQLSTQINLIEYVAIKYGLSVQGAVNKIAADFNIIQTKGLNYENNKKSFNFTHIKAEDSYSSDLIIKIKSRDWTESDIQYWNQYYIPVSLLERNNIKSISHIWLYKNDKRIFYTEFADTHPAFSYEYYWNEDIFRRKIYRPKCKEYKWISNTDYTVVQNYPNIPKYGDLLFMQSSYKDAMVMELMGYYAIAPNTESTWVPSYYWKKLKERWDKIIIFGNNDWDKKENPGLAYAIKNSKKYDIPYIVVPSGETSDISDYVKKYNLEEGKQLVDKLINKL